MNELLTQDTRAVYSLRCPGPKPDLDKALLEFLAYSLFNLIGCFWIVIPIAKQSPEEWVGWQLSLAGLWVCFVFPTLLAIGWSWLRTRSFFHHLLGLDHPTPRGWDHFLNHNRHFFVLFHLKGGKMLGGYFGQKSYASTYPQEPEIYVEQVWRVDEIGKFVEMVPGTLGAVVRQGDWERVEFLEIPYEETDGSSEGSAAGSVAGTAGGDSGTGTTGATAAPCGGSDRAAAGGIGDSAAAGQQQPTTQEVGADNGGQGEQQLGQQRAAGSIPDPATNEPSGERRADHPAAGWVGNGSPAGQ